MKKSIALLLALILSLGMVLGCQKAEVNEPVVTDAPQQEAEVTAEPVSEPTTEPVEEPTAEPVEESTPEPIVVVDQAGNTITLEKPAERVVTCFYGQTYAMVALGLTDKLVGMEKKASSRPVYAAAAPQLLELPNVGSQKEFNVEAAIALEPDVVLLPMKLKDTAATLEAVGITVVLCYPESQELLEEQLTLIATVCGAPEKAEALLDYYHTKFAEMETLTSALTDEQKPSVLVTSVSSYMAVAPDAMYQATLITNAGGVNAATGLEGTYWTDVSYEQLLVMNPDVIVIPSEAEYTPEDILADAQLADVTAVKNGAVYAMPNAWDAWDSPIPSGVLGTLWLMAHIHGDLYTMDQLTADVAYFYKTFYGFDADTSVLQ